MFHMFLLFHTSSSFISLHGFAVTVSNDLGCTFDDMIYFDGIWLSKGGSVGVADDICSFHLSYFFLVHGDLVG